MDLAARLETVEAENDVLRERIAILEEQLGARLPAPVCFGLSGSEARVFGHLYTREMATKNSIMAILYQSMGRDEAEPKIVDVFVCKLRKKLKPFGVAIETVWGNGYAMPAAAKARAKTFFEPL